MLSNNSALWRSGPEKVFSSDNCPFVPMATEPSLPVVSIARAVIEFVIADFSISLVILYNYRRFKTKKTEIFKKILLYKASK